MDKPSSSGQQVLSEKEWKFLRRQIRNVRNYLYFSITGVLIALGTVGHFAMQREFSVQQFMIVILLLLMARSNLKQHKDAKLLIKLSAGHPE